LICIVVCLEKGAFLTAKLYAKAISVPYSCQPIAYMSRTACNWRSAYSLKTGSTLYNNVVLFCWKRTSVFWTQWHFAQLYIYHRCTRSVIRAQSSPRWPYYLLYAYVTTRFAFRWW